ncbi:MAG: GIY-YIG nuclease family protein [Marinirhabdus sp.]
MQYCVYILYSKKVSRYYCGHTNNLNKRIRTHNSGGKKYTTGGAPWKLAAHFECGTRPEAIKLERRVKKRGIERYMLDMGLQRPQPS